MTILRTLLIIIFLVAALAVTVIVLMQEGKSAGLGSMAGGASSGDSYWAKNKKHSLEGKFERWTKITAAIFVLSAFLLMLIPNGSSTTENTPAGTTTEATTSENGDANVEVVTPEEGTSAEEATTGEEVTTGEEATDNDTTNEAASN